MLILLKSACVFHCIMALVYHLVIFCCFSE